MNISVRLIVYEVYVSLASSTQHFFVMLLIYLFQCSLFRTEIFECAKKSLGGHKKFCNFAVIEGNQMPLGIFM